jgi:hypothetical protein
MLILLFSPKHMVMHPSSHPAITCPTPALNVKGCCPGSLVLQNFTEGMGKFWSTRDPGQQPFTFNAGVGQVIAGWDEGCMTMCLGEKSRINMIGSKGYGAGGFPAWKIPPNAGLTFELEILSIH